MTLGLTWIAALAVVSAPIVAGACSIGYGGNYVIFPEKLILNFAPKKADSEETYLKRNLSFLKKELHIDDEQLQELIALLKKDELTEDKIIEKVQLFQDKITEFQQDHQEVVVAVDP